MFYTFTAYIVSVCGPQRKKVATGAGHLNNFDSARLFARGFACGVHSVFLTSVYVAFCPAGSDHVSWVFYPAP